MSANVNQAGVAVIVDDLRVAALEVIDHPVDGLFVAWDDARTQQNGVPGIDVREFVIVHCGAAERAHGLTLGSADHDQQLVGGCVFYLTGIDDQSLRKVKITEVLRDFSGVVQGTADDGYFASMLMG
jgi:hypothetical protein